MNEKHRIKTSKFLSLVLRHKPETIGLKLDSSGWVEVDELLTCLHRHGRKLTREQLNIVVETCEKQRFAISEDGRRIRASQGHSIEIELGYEPAEPPPFLFHGTARKNLAAILEKGLVKRGRHHVHLSLDYETATKVGQRHGKPVVLTVKAAAMRQAGFEFFCSANGVWLTECVPSEYLSLTEKDENLFGKG